LKIIGLKNAQTGNGGSVYIYWLQVKEIGKPLFNSDGVFGWITKDFAPQR